MQPLLRTVHIKIIQNHGLSALLGWLLRCDHSFLHTVSWWLLCSGQGNGDLQIIEMKMTLNSLLTTIPDT